MDPEERQERRILGVDFGLARVGLAVGTFPGGLVLPLPTLPHPGDMASLVVAIEAVCAEREVDTVVVGDPVYMDGSESGMSVLAERLRHVLAGYSDREVLLRDERCTSQEAEAALIGSGLRWWQYSKGQIDAMAAMSLVRDYLYELDPELALADAEAQMAEPPDPEKRKRRKRRERNEKARRRR